MGRIRIKGIKVALYILLILSPSFAQYLIKSHCIDDGGVATVTAGGYTLGISISQSFIGKIESGGYTAYIGYWPPWGSIPGIEESEQNRNFGQPIVFSLSQNYPNPVSTRTIIKYSIAIPCKVELALFDVTGRQVTLLLNENQKAGYYQINWNIRNVSEKQLPNGVYFYRLTAGNYTNVKKLVIVR